MASESLIAETDAREAAEETEFANDPALYGAAPVKGNYTGDAYMHLWCANALSSVVGNDDAFGDWNDDIQAALRYLLKCEVARARAAFSAETAEAERAKVRP